MRTRECRHTFWSDAATTRAGRVLESPSWSH
jgi:hypothetical protein